MEIGIIVGAGFLIAVVAFWAGVRAGGRMGLTIGWGLGRVAEFLHGERERRP